MSEIVYKSSTADNLFLTKTSAASTYYTVTEAPITPQRYGTTGTADDTATFQAWLNALASTKGDGYIPSGTYNVGALTFSGSYGEIRGSRSVTLKLIAGANAPLLSTPNDTTQRNGLRLFGFTLDGNAANQTGTSPLLDIYGMNDFFLERMYIANPRGAGLRMGAAGTMSCLNPYIVNNLFRGDSTNTQGAAIELDSKSSDCHLGNNDIGFFTLDSGVLLSGHNGGEVQNNMVWQCKFGYHNFAAHRTRFANNLSDLAKQHGYFMQNSNDLQFSNCQARESGQSSNNIYDGFNISGASTGSPATDIVMTGTRAMGSKQRYGINFAGSLSRCNAYSSSLNGNFTGGSNNDATNVSCSIA